MKEKRTYSLTAKERKQKRLAAENKKNGTAKPTFAKSTQSKLSAEAEMALSQKRSKQSAIIIGCVVALAVLLIIAALLAPVIMFVVNPYRGYKDVIARFKLSNGMTLEYVIEEDKYDTAATNFIFLAKNKFFDNTVFYDAQGGWLRFGGYEAQPLDSSSSASDYSRTKYRGDSKAYCDSFDAIANSYFEKDANGNYRTTYKFGYRLRQDADGTDTNVINQLGALTFRYENTSTEFQFYYGDYAETVPNDIAQIKCTMVGHALNDKTLRNIQAIASSNPTRNPNLSTGYIWTPPTPTIKINTVTVYNLDNSKWRNFDFVKYVSGNDKSGARRYTSWIGKN